jgi:hypothetical protein
MGHTEAVADTPTWIRPVAAIVLFIALGAVVLAGTAWLAVKVLPDGEATIEDDVPGLETADVSEVGPADPADFATQVDSCDVVANQVRALGRLQNLATRPQAYVIHVAVVVDDVLLPPAPGVPVATLEPGEDEAWGAVVAGLDPEDPGATAPTCEIDRVGLGDELDTSG